MAIAWGVVLIVLSLVAWGGQAISWLAPDTAVRWGLTEAEESVEPVYWADIRGEALWDTVSLWTLVIAGVLLIADQASWPYIGLVGGGMYAYFAGRGLVTRVMMRHHGYRIGTSQNVKAGYVFLAVWLVMGLITIAAAARALQTT